MKVTDGYAGIVLAWGMFLVSIALILAIKVALW
jgi:hypothetical protein